MKAPPSAPIGRGGEVGQAELVVQQSGALDLGELVAGDGLAFLGDNLAAGLERLVGESPS